MSYQITPPVKRLLVLQCLAGVALACAFLALSVPAAYSALTGAAIGFLPNAYFALRVFDMSKGRCAQSTLSAFYIGVTGKIVVTAGLFSVAFLLLSPLHAPALFTGFVAIQLMHWIALLK